MNNILYISFAVILAIMLSCNHRHSAQYGNLMTVDSILMCEQPESALVMLNAIDTTKGWDDECRAVYCMLSLHIRYWLGIEQDANQDPNRAIEYFQSNGQKLMLARLLHYKAMLSDGQGRREEAVLMEKQAEEAIEGMEAPELKYRIFHSLSYLNHVSGNIREAQKYAMQALNEANITGKPHFVCMAYEKLIYCSRSLGEYDSEQKYAEKIIPHLYKVKEIYRPNLLLNVCVAYINNGNYGKAEKYAQEGIKISGDARFYAQLGDILIHQNRWEEGVAMLRKVLSELRGIDRWQAMQLIEDVMAKKGNHVEAAKLQEQITLLKDSIADSKKTENIKSVQEDYDRQRNDERSDKKNAVYCAVILLCVMVIAAVVVISRYRDRRHVRMVTLGHDRLDLYRRRLDDVMLNDRNNIKEIRRLKRMMERQKTVMYNALEHGNKMFDEVVKRNKINHWSDADIVDFIEYYRILHPKFVAHVENDFVRLTPINKLVMILEHMQLTNDEIQKILGKSAGALRTMKSRINNRNTFIAEV